jgi:indolepyruvate decarboxylase
MVLKKVVPLIPTVSPVEMDAQPVLEAIREAEEMINNARKPVIVAGVELMRYGLEGPLLEFAEQTNIPIASSMLSKSVVDERHPLYLGLYQGGMSHEGVRDYVESSECVIFLGMFMTDINLGIFTAHLDQGRSIFSTSDKTSLRHHTYNAVSLNSFLPALLKSNIRRKETASMPRPTVPGEFKVHQGKPVTIERVLEVLETTLDGTTFVIADTGDALFATADITIPRTAEYMSSAYYASMGFAVPASLAVQLAFPDLRPIVIVGDGAFQMTGMEPNARCSTANLMMSHHGCTAAYPRFWMQAGDSIFILKRNSQAPGWKHAAIRRTSAYWTSTWIQRGYPLHCKGLQAPSANG